MSPVLPAPARSAAATPIIRFEDELAKRDLATFLGRAGRIEDGAVRIIGGDGVVSVWVPILRPQGILDASPTVLGMRSFRARVEHAAAGDERGGAFDVTVPLRGLLDRLARTGETDAGDERDAASLPVPPDRVLESWASMTPERSGWERVGAIPTDELVRAAEEGIAAVAEAVPGNLGTLLVERVRTSVWERELDAVSFDDAANERGFARPTAGAAYAAYSLGFLSPGRTATIAQQGRWLLAATERGNVVLHGVRRPR